MHRRKTDLLLQHPKMKVFSFVIHCVVKFPFFIENDYIATTETKAKRKILNSKI